MHRISVTGSTNELLKSVSLPESVKVEIENETVTFSVQSEDEIKKIKEIIADELSDIIVRKYTKQIFEEVLRAGYNFSDSEKEKLLPQFADNDFYCDKLLVRKKLSHFLSHSDTIDIKGFTKFRLWEYRRLLTGKIYEYNKKTESEEFFELIKIYIDSMPCLEKKINLCVLKGGGYAVFSESFEDITEKCIKRLGTDAVKDLSFDELLLSLLISAVPEEIVVHNEKFCKSRELIEIIEKLFGERIIKCHGCKLCKENL